MTALHSSRSRRTATAALTLALALGLAGTSPQAWGRTRARTPSRPAAATTPAPAATPTPAATTTASTTTTTTATTGVPPLLAAPAATAGAPSAAAQAEAADTGFSLTVKTEEESPFSIVIAPWIKSTPRADAERPARLYDEAAEPIDPDVFARRVDFYEKTYASTEPRRAAAASAERRAAATPVGTGTPTNAAGSKSGSGFGSLFNFGPTIAAPRASPASPARPGN